GAITPDVVRPTLDVFTTHTGELVGDLQGTETELTGEAGGEFVALTTFAARKCAARAEGAGGRGLCGCHRHGEASPLIFPGGHLDPRPELAPASVVPPGLRVSHTEMVAGVSQGRSLHPSG